MPPVATHLLIDLVQAAFLLAFAPLLEGMLKCLEEIIQGKRTPWSASKRSSRGTW